MSPRFLVLSASSLKRAAYFAMTMFSVAFDVAYGPATPVEGEITRVILFAAVARSLRRNALMLRIMPTTFVFVCRVHGEYER